MTGFPDESQMPRSDDGTEPIRGGSIGFNRILGRFVQDAGRDTKPRFNAVIISAFTIFRNVWGTKKDANASDLEQGFITDVNLFLEYYDAYLSAVWSRMYGDKFCPVVVYFPDYKHVPKEILKEHSGRGAEFMAAYKAFLIKHSPDDGEVKRLNHCRCVWISAGHATYPHKEVVRKFREITSHPSSLYTTGDPVCLITHTRLDYHISSRLRGVQLLESHTATIRTPGEFRFRLDKDGRVPFQSAVHVTLGDSDLIKPFVGLKIKREILEAAEKERWLTRSEEDVRNRIAKISNIPVATFRKYDFV